MRSTKVIRAAAAGTKGAGLGEQHHQRGLAQVGGLAGHVRAGEHRQPRITVESGVVGDEGLAAERGLDHRVTRVPELQGAAVVLRGVDELRAHAVAFRGPRGETLEHVQLGQRARGGEHARRLGGGGVAQLLEQPVLEVLGLLLGAEHLLLMLLELRSDVTLGVLERLLA